ncbi:hypothetical protein STRDD10_00667 [Streptococcus sp. DD10]|nr:hypothetical protein STRDD10_00667 [Streptococcus sp. DD10]
MFFTCESIYDSNIVLFDKYFYFFDKDTCQKEKDVLQYNQVKKRYIKEK